MAEAEDLEGERFHDCRKYDEEMELSCDQLDGELSKPEQAENAEWAEDAERAEDEAWEQDNLPDRWWDWEWDRELWLVRDRTDGDCTGTGWGQDNGWDHVFSWEQEDTAKQEDKSKQVNGVAKDAAVSTTGTGGRTAGWGTGGITSGGCGEVDGPEEKNADRQPKDLQTRPASQHIPPVIPYGAAYSLVPQE